MSEKTSTTDDVSAKQMDAKQPTREELVKWYEEQIEMATLRHKLTTLQSETVQAEALRYEAMAVIAKYQGQGQKSDSPE